MARTVAPTKKVVLRFNNRQYNPGEWEAWCESEVVAHAADRVLLEEKYPQASIVPLEDEA